MLNSLTSICYIRIYEMNNYHSEEAKYIFAIILIAIFKRYIYFEMIRKF